MMYLNEPKTEPPGVTVTLARGTALEVKVYFCTAD